MRNKYEHLISISGNLHSSKNSRKIVPNRNQNGQPFWLVKSTSAKRDERIFGSQIVSRFNDVISTISKYQKPFRLLFFIRRESKGIFDYVNIIQNLLDIMVDCGVIDDDNADNIIPEFIGYEVNKKNPGVDIYIAEQRKWTLLKKELVEVE